MKRINSGEDVLPIDELKTRAAFFQAVEEGTRAVREGDVHPHDEAVAILESFGK